MNERTGENGKARPGENKNALGSSRRQSLAGLTLEELKSSKAGTAHAGLWLDRYLRTQDRADDAARRTLVTEVASLPIPPDYAEAFERWALTLNAAGATLLQASVLNRMSVGLGGESALETYVTLHRTYGVPYIPGSALKGLAAAFARRRLGDDWRVGGPAYQLLFGDTTSAGFVTFYDALPIVKRGGPFWPDKHPMRAQLEKRASQSLLEPDILTVHHAEYYMSTTGEPPAPADWDDPIPVPFLSAVGTYLLGLSGPEEWVHAACAILEQALEEEGVGGKTSSGYGRMNVTWFDLKLLETEASQQAALSQRPAPLGAGIGAAQARSSQPPTSEDKASSATLHRNKGDGTLTAQLPGGRKAEARRPRADALWNALPDELKKRIDKGKPVPVLVRVSPIGNAWQLDSIEPVDPA